MAHTTKTVLNRAFKCNNSIERLRYFQKKIQLVFSLPTFADYRTEFNESERIQCLRGNMFVLVDIYLHSTQDFVFELGEVSKMSFRQKNMNGQKES